MSDVVTVTNRDGVAVITLQSPPVNGLGCAVRSSLQAALEAATADDAVSALVVTGAGKMFSGGADIREFGQSPPPGTPQLPTVIDAIEASEKPVVAAIHGFALGGGLELALGCHVRVAAAGTRVALPEVTLGIVPGAGGTQRLPRLIGVPAALEVIVGGSMVPAARARTLGILDDVVEGDVVDAAVTQARRMVNERMPLRRASGTDDRVAETRGKPEVFDAFKKKMARRARGFEAPYACVECIEAAANLPYAEGTAKEREVFVKLLASDQSKAQRHAFFAERQVAKIADVPKDTPSRPVKTAAVIGCGTMGGGIAMNFANAGIPVTVFEVSQAALDKGLGIIGQNYAATVSKGRLSQEDMNTRLGLISNTVSYDDLSDADVVIEAVFEDMALKREVFGQLDAACKPEAILATNTSTLDVDEIASATSRPDKVIGTHFFSPANVMKLMENVRGAQSSAETIATIMKLSKTIGKIGVLVGICDGFVGNRMLYAYRRQADFLLEEGALPDQIDKVIYDFGMPMGPYAMGDLAGLDGGRPGLRARSVRTEDERGLVPLRTGQPHPDSGSGRQRVGASGVGGQRIQTARGQRPRDPGALHVPPGQRGREDPRRGAGPARQRYRRRLDVRLRVPTLPRRSDVLGRPGRSRHHLRHDASTARRARRLLVGTGAAAQAARRARPWIRRPVGFLPRRPSGGVAASVTARLAALSLRLARRTQLLQTGLRPEPPRPLRGDPECPTPRPRGAHCRAPSPGQEDSSARGVRSRCSVRVGSGRSLF